MKKASKLTFIILISILAGCASPQVRPVNPTPSQPPASPVITMTPSVTALPPTKTATATLVMPAIRTPQAREALPASGSVEFHILHWNDFHGELVERNNGEGTWIPGAARLAAYVNTALDEYGRENTLLLDAGDWFENTDIKKESKPAKGRDVLAFYQRLGVDAVTVGNHDLFLGLPYFRTMVARSAPLQVLSVNLRKMEGEHTWADEPVVNPYQIYELGAPAGPKVRLAVIGISAENLQREAYRPILEVCFTDPVAELEKIYDELMDKEKPDVVVLVSHSAIDVDQQIAQALNDAGRPVDLIIGGHSHTWMEAPEKVGKTVIVQAGDYGRAVGHFDLVYDRAASALRVQWQLDTLTPSSPKDRATLDFLKGLGYAAPVPTFTVKRPDYTYLSDLQPASASVGYWSLGKGVFPATDAGITEGQEISSHGKQYPRGLFAHSPSDLRYVLDGKFRSFAAEISIKETACGDGASFTILVDKHELYSSGIMLPGDAPKPIVVDVSGGKVLELKTSSGADINCDWTIWGDPYLIPVP